jgi:hypothetical protein
VLPDEHLDNAFNAKAVQCPLFPTDVATNHAIWRSFFNNPDSPEAVTFADEAVKVALSITYSSGRHHGVHPQFRLGGAFIERFTCPTRGETIRARKRIDGDTIIQEYAGPQINPSSVPGWDRTWGLNPTNWYKKTCDSTYIVGPPSRFFELHKIWVRNICDVCILTLLTRATPRMGVLWQVIAVMVRRRTPGFTWLLAASTSRHAARGSTKGTSSRSTMDKVAMFYHSYAFLTTIQQGAQWRALKAIDNIPPSGSRGALVNGGSPHSLTPIARTRVADAVVSHLAGMLEAHGLDSPTIEMADMGCGDLQLAKALHAAALDRGWSRLHVWGIDNHEAMKELADVRQRPVCKFVPGNFAAPERSLPQTLLAVTCHDQTFGESDRTALANKIVACPSILVVACMKEMAKLLRYPGQFKKVQDLGTQKRERTGNGQNWCILVRSA